ncbi:MAG: hypothetical protein CM1200mP30_34110 [Pseudomonadota bacterium]|nr:MAG: hypothetical protein CM1200mP30_34110 [Pseudomonadota bacterium]
MTKGYEPMGKGNHKELGDKIDILCASVGTGGAIMGAWKGLRKAIPKIELVAFEPLQSPLLTTGEKGGHIKLKVSVLDLNLLFFGSICLNRNWGPSTKKKLFGKVPKASSQGRGFLWCLNRLEFGGCN